MDNNKTCKEQVREAYQSRMADIRKLYEAGYGEDVEDVGTLENYGLCIDKVEGGTFENQPNPYLRYQLSFGGPSEEFRISPNGNVTFWFMDWFDGAYTHVKDEDAEIIKAIVEDVGVNFKL